MKIFKNKTRIIIISLIAGAFITLMARASIFALTTDNFHYVGGLTFEVNHTNKNIGKNVIGGSGLPFGYYTECKSATKGGEVPYVRVKCEKISSLGSYSMLLNFIFWSLLVYLILQLKKSRDN
jgi:hypothetical protein